jgi:two-component system, response regulator
MSKNVDIILVEDSDCDAELTLRALRKSCAGHELIRLRDGADALEYLFEKSKFSGEERQKLPRLLIIDLKMPKVNGIEVLQRVKTNERTRAIPVVVLSSSNHEQDIETCYKYGANSYVVKPMEFDTYTRTVSEVSSYWLTHNQALK